MRGFSCDDETEVSSVILPWVRQVNHHITEFIRIETKALTACSALLLSAPCLNRSCYQCYCTIQSYKSTVLCNETQHVCRRQGLDYRCSCSQNTAAAGVSTRVATRQWILGLYTAVANRFIQCQLVTNMLLRCVGNVIESPRTFNDRINFVPFLSLSRSRAVTTGATASLESLRGVQHLQRPIPLWIQKCLLAKETRR